MLVAAFARGKQIGELDFAQWEVRVAGFEREFKRSEADPALVLEEGISCISKGCAGIDQSVDVYERRETEGEPDESWQRAGESDKESHIKLVAAVA